MSNIGLSVDQIITIILGGGGVVGALGYAINYWIRGREIKINQLEHKAEQFLAGNVIHWNIATYAYFLSELLEKERSKENAENRDYIRCLFFLISYLQSHDKYFKKIGSYFLDDPIGETLLFAIEKNIHDELREGFTQAEIDNFFKLLARNERQVDLEGKLVEASIQPLYNKFKLWLDSADIKNLIADLMLYYDVSNYEINKIFKGWYENKHRIDEHLESLRYIVITKITKDKRYVSYNIV